MKNLEEEAQCNPKRSIKHIKLKHSEALHVNTPSRNILSCFQGCYVRYLILNAAIEIHLPTTKYQILYFINVECLSTNLHFMLRLIYKLIVLNSVPTLA